MCALIQTILGVADDSGRNRKEVFQHVVDNIWKRLNRWKGAQVFKSGKEILLKTVIQVIPYYMMSLFILPKNIGDKMEKLMNRF